MSRQVIQYAVTFGASTLISIYYALFSSEISLVYMLMLLMATVNLALISAMLIVVDDSLKNLQNYVIDFKAELNICIVNLISRLHRPSAALIVNSSDLVKSIANSIRETTEDTADRVGVLFLGATSLQTAPEGDAEVSTLTNYEDEDGQSPHQIYQGALEEATSKKSPIVRLVSLPTVEEMLSRSRSVQTDYSRWLRNQLSQLARNENYLLIDTPRTPKWGVSGMRVISGENIYDITHKNGIAIHIRDVRIAVAQTEKIVKGAFSGAKANIIIYGKKAYEGRRFGKEARRQNLTTLEHDLKALNEHLQGGLSST